MESVSQSNYSKLFSNVGLADKIQEIVYGIVENQTTYVNGALFIVETIIQTTIMRQSLKECNGERAQ